MTRKILCAAVVAVAVPALMTTRGVAGQQGGPPARASRPAGPPPVFFSTLFGDDSSEESLGRASVAIDRRNTIIVVGTTRSSAFPATPGVVKSALTGATDIFVATFDADLKTLVAATLIGGSGGESSGAIAVDPRGDLYLTGTTTSKDFPAGAAVLGRDTEAGARRTFVLKLSGDLTKVLASAVLSAESAPRTGASEVVYDERRQRLLVGGTTASPGFPTTPGAYRTANPSGNAKKYVAILDPGLTRVVAATLLGGDEAAEPAVVGLLTDRAGHVFVGGSTFSRDYPTTERAFKRTVQAAGVYGVVSKLSPDLKTLVASTFVGEIGNDFIYGLALDQRENVVFAGHLADAMPTTPRAYLRTNRGNPDVANVGILSNDLSALVASTFVCGGGEGSFYGGFSFFGPVMIDRAGSIFVRGLSGVPYFPTTPGAFDDTQNGARDTVIVRLNADLSSLTASTFLGGSGADQGDGMALDRAGHVVVVGTTSSKDFPTSGGAYQTTLNGRRAYFVTKLGSELADPEQRPAHQAARDGDLVRLKTLIGRDASLMRQTDRYRRVPLHWAARFGRLDAVRWLVGRGADVIAQDDAGDTPLHVAALRSQGAAAELLVASGADVNRANSAGDTALHLAALVGHDETVRLLLAGQANPNLRNARSLTALHRAVFSRHRDVAESLLNGGADPTIANDAGETPLHLAVTVLRNEATVALLIKRGARVNAANARKQTPLHHAAGYTWEANAIELLAASPDVNVQDETGQTPLHNAVRSSLERIVRALLEKGADPTLVDKKGKSPIDLARDNKATAIVEWLEKAAAAQRRIK